MRMENKWILYQTTNKINSKIYIGVHKLADTYCSKNYLGSGKRIKLAVEKYGKENFTRITLAEFSSAEEAYVAESEMVNEEFAKRSDTYNIKMGGKGGTGIVHTTESKEKMSIASKGKVMSQESRIKMSAAKKGRIVSDESRAKISAAMKGNKRSLGKTHTTEAKKKMSASKGSAVVINGKYYESARIAAKIENLSHPTILRRVRNTKQEWSEYRFASVN
jgi:group I intron endonuclease